MKDTVKLIIEIPKKTIEHIRSNYGHGCKGLYDEDRDKIVNAIYHGTPLDDVKAEMLKYSSEHYVHDDNVWTYIGIIDKHIGKAESKGET